MKRNWYITRRGRNLTLIGTILVAACLVAGCGITINPMPGSGTGATTHGPTQSANQAMSDEAAVFDDVVGAVPPPVPLSAVTHALSKMTPTHKPEVSVVVLDPVAVGNPPADVADFGKACGRWLDLEVSGQSEFGASPEWDDRDRIVSETKSSSLAMSYSPQIATIVGANYVVDGTISGGPNNCSISLSVHSVQTGQLVGAPLTSTGTEAEILEHLPDLAKQVCANLGLKTPQISSTASDTPATFAAFSEWVRQLAGSFEAIPVPAAIAAGAKHDALLAAYVVRSGADHTVPGNRAAAQRLLALAPNNQLALDLVWRNDYSIMAKTEPSLRALLSRYPGSLCLCEAASVLDRAKGRYTLSIAEAAQGVGDSPANPRAWSVLGDQVDSVAEAVRLGRWGSYILPSDWTFIKSLSPEYQYDAQKSVTLDPDYASAWYWLANAALANDDSQKATSAFWRAWKLEGKSARLLRLGLNMFQPKWFDDGDSLNRVAEAVSTAKLSSASDIVDVAKSLREAGLTADADTLENNAVAKMRRYAAGNPHNDTTLAGLARIETDQGHVGDAETDLRHAMQIDPHRSLYWYLLGQMYDLMNNPPQAIRAYKAALAIEPDYPDALYWLAEDLRESLAIRQCVAAASHLLSVSQFYPGGWEVMGDALESENWLAAYKAYKESVATNPFGTRVYAELANCLDRQGKYEDSLQYGRLAALIDPQDTRNSSTVEDDFLHLHMYDKTLAMCQAVLKFAPNDSYSQENIAEAYFGQGKKDEAKAQWRKVVALDPDGGAGQLASGYLAKYQ